MCKDFFIDKFQIPLAKSYGADAILIILAGVSDKLADDLYNEALKLNMSVIVEVHTICLLYTSPSPRDATLSRMPSSAWKKK